MLLAKCVPRTGLRTVGGTRRRLLTDVNIYQRSRGQMSCRRNYMLSRLTSCFQLTSLSLFLSAISAIVSPFFIYACSHLAGVSTRSLPPTPKAITNSTSAGRAPGSACSRPPRPFQTPVTELHLAGFVARRSLAPSLTSGNYTANDLASWPFSSPKTMPHRPLHPNPHT